MKNNRVHITSDLEDVIRKEIDERMGHTSVVIIPSKYNEGYVMALKWVLRQSYALD
jgi:hypothetical protein